MHFLTKKTEKKHKLRHCSCPPGGIFDFLTNLRNEGRMQNFSFFLVFHQKRLILEGIRPNGHRIPLPHDLLYPLVGSNPPKIDFLIFFEFWFQCHRLCFLKQQKSKKSQQASKPASKPASNSIYIYVYIIT